MQQSNSQAVASGAIKGAGATADYYSSKDKE
jgi:hypothetical protein